jgi:hypothetical protein
MKEDIKISRPSVCQVNKYILHLDALENYTLQEKSLKKLFLKTYPHNVKIEDVLIKVCSLNDFYSTHILSPFTIAKHIVSLKIDKDLLKEDLALVNKIGKVEMSDGITRNFYSFATKYCSHHKPKIYPIYDYYVEKILMYFKRKDAFSNFKKDDLREYSRYRDIIIEFQQFYGLKKYNLKQIDKYLWQLGKEYFPRTY